MVTARVGLVIGLAVGLVAGLVASDLFHAESPIPLVTAPDVPLVRTGQDLETAVTSSRRTAPAKREETVAAPVAESVVPTAVSTEDLKGIELETDPMRARWRVLRYGLQEYRKLEVKNPMGSREGTVASSSVGAILEATGRGVQPLPNDHATRDTYYGVTRGLAYRWSVGEFPEYDAWHSYMLAIGEYNEELQRNPELTTPAPTFDPSNFALIEARAEEAIALLEFRYGFTKGPK